MNTWKINLAAHCIHQGGVIAYPTEAVYGLGCDPLNPQAVMRLLQIKQRPMAKGLILVAADFDQIEPYIQPLSAKQRQTLEATWPGAITWLVPAATAVPKWLTGEHASIALRITNHPTTVALCKRCGHALVSTSANPTSQKAAKTSLMVRRYFRSQLDFILNAPLGSTEKPSEIRDLISGQTVRPG